MDRSSMSARPRMVPLLSSGRPWCPLVPTSGVARSAPWPKVPPAFRSILEPLGSSGPREGRSAGRGGHLGPGALLATPVHPVPPSGTPRPAGRVGWEDSGDGPPRPSTARGGEEGPEEFRRLRP
eukprot:9502958-Pyramimonas_sp.AAC.1